MESSATSEVNRAGRSIRQGSEEAKSEIKDTLQEASQSVSRAAGEMAHNARQRGEEIYQQVRDGSSTQLRNLEDQIRSNPLRAIAISAVAGFLLSRMMRE